MVGGKPWYGKVMSTRGYYLQPTIGDRGSADFFLYRTLWENKVYDPGHRSELLHPRRLHRAGVFPTTSPQHAQLRRPPARREHAVLRERPR